ncbi:MAG: ABC transporter substrate-binding protein [Treponema sp.]|jgi:raffinose/stachyose/melibiose transport system substrate-binding protein|nr:ABC transporter substrate-binding protein [Treponema sp.]
MKKGLSFLVVLLVCGTMIFATGAGQKAGGAQGDTVSLLWTRNTIIDGHELIMAEIEKRFGIKTEVEIRVGGAEGETIVKTRLAAGDMADFFIFNTGSKVNDINPDRNCVDLTGDYGSKVAPLYKSSASSNGKMYSVPVEYTAQGGVIFYNKKIYQRLGLQIPKTWKEFLDNCDKIQASGIPALLGTFKDTWTSQLIFLSEEYYIKSAMPDWPQQYTANKSNYSNNPAALRSFEKLAETAKYLNRDYLATNLSQGLEMLANGEVAQFSMQSHRIQYIDTNIPDKINDIGIFAQPGDDPNNIGVTVWMPSGLYIYKNSSKIDAVKKWLDFLLTQEAFNLYTSKVKPGGPSVVNGLKLPSDAIPGILDMQQYFDANKYQPALEFESPVKGPNLEQLCIEVVTGRMTPRQAAVAYDQDVQKQAVLLNLPGW